MVQLLCTAVLLALVVTSGTVHAAQFSLRGSGGSSSNFDGTSTTACDFSDSAASGALTGFGDALRLSKPLPVERIPGFSEGHVSIQDAASQLAAELLDAEPGMRVLDACAAPGVQGHA